MRSLSIAVSDQRLVKLKKLLLIAAVVPLLFSGVASANNKTMTNQALTAEIDQSVNPHDSDRQNESSGAVGSEQMRLALSRAKASGRDVMVVFGADWCDRCALLKRYMVDSPLQDRIQSQFIVLHVDVGYWDKNQRYEAQMGHPTREGLPAVVIADSSDEFSNIMTSEELVTFLPDRDQPIYDWMDRVLKYAEQTYAIR